MDLPSQDISIKTIQKGTILQKEGEIGTKAYYVKKGLLRSYIIDKKGKEHIYMFAPEDWIVADSNPAEEPARLYIDALEESIVVEMKKDPEQLEPEVSPLLRRIRVLQNRVIMLMSYSAIERYEHFCDTYPDILQRVPQKMIASYLGITPEALSKVKGMRSKSQ